MTNFYFSTLESFIKNDILFQCIRAVAASAVLFLAKVITWPDTHNKLHCFPGQTSSPICHRDASPPPDMCITSHPSFFPGLKYHKLTSSALLNFLYFRTPHDFGAASPLFLIPVSFRRYPRPSAQRTALLGSIKWIFTDEKYKSYFIFDWGNARFLLVHILKGRLNLRINYY